MKSFVLFSALLLGLLLSCKKETQYRSTSIQDTIITPNSTIEKDTVVVRDTLTPDTAVYPKDSVIRKK